MKRRDELLFASDGSLYCVSCEPPAPRPPPLGCLRTGLIVVSVPLIVLLYAAIFVLNECSKSPL